VRVCQNRLATGMSVRMASSMFKLPSFKRRGTHKDHAQDALAALRKEQKRDRRAVEQRQWNEDHPAEDRGVIGSRWLKD